MVIGVTGSFGAGKGEVVRYLTDVHGFKHYSVSGFLKEEIARRGIVVNRDSMILIGNELRKEHGSTYLVDTLYAKASEYGGNAVVESLRTSAEVARIRALGGFVIGVDAPVRLRYERAYARASEKDNVTFEQFLEQERQEQNRNDSTKQNTFEALASSDVVVQNDSSKEDLFARVGEVLCKVM